MCIVSVSPCFVLTVDVLSVYTRGSKLINIISKYLSSETIKYNSWSQTPQLLSDGQTDAQPVVELFKPYRMS